MAARQYPRCLQLVYRLSQLQQAPLRCSSSSLRTFSDTSGASTSQPAAQHTPQQPRDVALERKQYRGQLSELRKRWAEEKAAEQARLAEAEQQAARERKQRALSRQLQQKAEDEEKRQQQATEAADRAAKREQARAAAAGRRAAREAVYARLNQERRRWLLEQSRHWVRPEELEARIAEALDNPVPLAAAVGGANTTVRDPVTLPPRPSKWMLPEWDEELDMFEEYEEELEEQEEEEKEEENDSAQQHVG